MKSGEKRHESICSSDDCQLMLDLNIIQEISDMVDSTLYTSRCTNNAKVLEERVKQSSFML